MRKKWNYAFSFYSSKIGPVKVTCGCHVARSKVTFVPLLLRLCQALKTINPSLFPPGFLTAVLLVAFAIGRPLCWYPRLGQHPSAGSFPLVWAPFSTHIFPRRLPLPLTMDFSPTPATASCLISEPDIYPQLQIPQIHVPKCLLNG